MIKNIFFDFKKTFDKELEKYFDEKIREAEKSKEISAGMLKVLKEFTLRGGKRIRPALAYYSYLCFSDENTEEIVKAGIAIELVQSFLLIHDDIMDNDNFRRGKPTVHSIYSEYFSDSHLGLSLAIICGDLACSLANEVMLSITLPAERVVKAAKRLNKILNKVGLGQELDVVSSIKKHISEEELFLIHKLKTATYTFEMALLVGSVLAGAGEKEMDVLKEYSTPMGQAFQMQDDILGLFGDEKKLGKPVGSDIRHGKMNLLMIKAKEKCSEKDKEFLNQILGKPSVSKEDIGCVRRIVKESGSLDYSKKKIEKLLNESRKLVLGADFKEVGKNFLLELTDFMKNRDY